LLPGHAERLATAPKEARGAAAAEIRLLRYALSWSTCGAPRMVTEKGR
jgi:hypothetical protein